MSYSGGDRIISKLNRIASGLSNSGKDAMEKSVKKGIEHSRTVVPVDTGALKKSLATEVKPSESTVIGTLKAQTKYAKFVEYGTSRTREQKYLRPGREIAFKELKTNLKNSIRQLFTS